MAGQQDIDVPARHASVEQPSADGLNNVGDVGGDDIELVPQEPALGRRSVIRTHAGKIPVRGERLSTHRQLHSDCATTVLMHASDDVAPASPYQMQPGRPARPRTTLAQPRLTETNCPTASPGGPEARCNPHRVGGTLLPPLARRRLSESWRDCCRLHEG